MGFSAGRYPELWVLKCQSWLLPANPREKQWALRVRTLLRDDTRSGGSFFFMKLLCPQVLHSHGTNGGSVTPHLPSNREQPQHKR